MRMSCNGCRVLRKGCTENCTIRPCLQWIKTPESQANATLFLAKFYGRAGLVNLLSTGPDHLRPAIFRSLLYEACGRIINPIYGAVGLMWTGNWHQCQAAVEAVLNGSPLMQLPIEDAAAQAHPIVPLESCNIRHMSKEPDTQLHRGKTRNRFKRSRGRSCKSVIESEAVLSAGSAQLSIGGGRGGNCGGSDELNQAPSLDSFSVETVEMSLANRFEDNEVGLELTLGLNPLLRTHLSTVKE